MVESGLKFPVFKTLPVRIIIPAALTIALFVTAIFWFILPMLETYLMDAKREGILNLTDSAWSILALCHEQEQSGQLTKEAAQARAIELLSHLRYGPQGSDYFWINDYRPVMIMHPYRRDLVGKYVGSFQDPSGKYLFVHMVDTVEKSGAGFVEYLWQWKDDPLHIAPKLSYVRGFTHWGWIIGTGIYVQDVKAQIHKVTHTLFLACMGISAAVVVLCIYIIWAGYVEQRARISAIEQSRRREKQLIQADKMSSLGVMVAGVAHEINNPASTLILNATNLKNIFRSYAPVLERYFAANPGARVCNMAYPEARRRTELMLEAMAESAEQVKKIIADLKDFSRPPGSEATQQIDMNQVVNKSVELVKSILKDRTARLVIRYGEHLPRIQGDFQKLQQVLVNLLVNAGQALENDNETIYVSTFADRENGVVGVEVKDTGPGVPQDLLGKLTDPFFTTRRDEGGTGLGLSISQKIVNEHNGSLIFSSEPGKGFTAKVLIPSRDV